MLNHWATLGGPLLLFFKNTSLKVLHIPWQWIFFMKKPPRLKAHEDFFMWKTRSNAWKAKEGRCYSLKNLFNNLNSYPISGIILGARDMKVSAIQTGDRAFLSQGILKQWLMTTWQRCNRGDMNMWGGNDLDSLFLSLETSHFHSSILILFPCLFPQILWKSEPHSKTCMRSFILSSDPREEEWTMETELGRKKRHYKDVLSGYSLLWTTGTQSLQDLLRIHHAVQNYLPKGWGGEPLSTSSLMLQDLQLSRVATWGVYSLDTPGLVHTRMMSGLLGRKQRQVWQLRQGGVWLHLHEAGCCSNTLLA